MIGLYLDRTSSDNIIHDVLKNKFEALDIGYVILDVPSFETQTAGYGSLNAIIEYLNSGNIDISLYFPWKNNNEISDFTIETIVSYITTIKNNINGNIDGFILGSYNYISGIKTYLPLSVIDHLHNDDVFSYISVDHCEDREVFNIFSDHINFWTIYKIDDKISDPLDDNALVEKGKILEGVSIKEMLEKNHTRILSIHQMTNDPNDHRMSTATGHKWLANAFVYARQNDIWILHAFQDNIYKTGLIDSSNNVKDIYYSFLALKEIENSIGSKHRPKYYELFEKRKNDLYIKSGRINSKDLNDNFSTLFGFVEDSINDYNEIVNDYNYLNSLIETFNSYISKKIDEIEETQTIISGIYSNISVSGIIYTHVECFLNNIIESKYIQTYKNYIYLQSNKEREIFSLTYDPRYDDLIPYKIDMKLDGNELTPLEIKKILYGYFVFPQGDHTLEIDLKERSIPFTINFLSFRNLTNGNITNISFDTGFSISNPREVEIFEPITINGHIEINYNSSEDFIFGFLNIGYKKFPNAGYFLYEVNLDRHVNNIIGINTDIRNYISNLIYDDYFKLEVYTDESYTNKIYDSTENPYPLTEFDSSIVLDEPLNKFYIKITLIPIRPTISPIISRITMLFK